MAFGGMKIGGGTAVGGAALGPWGAAAGAGYDTLKNNPSLMDKLEKFSGMGSYDPNVSDINDKAFDSSSLTSRQGSLAKQLAASQNRANPTMRAAIIDQSQQNQFRGGQQMLASQLVAQSMGQGPSLAQGQLQQATDRNIAQSMALAASQRGNAGGNLRSVMQNQALANQQAAQQSAQLRAQEQMSAREQLAGVLSGARGQDIGLAQSQAELTQGASQQNLLAALQAQQQKDQMAQFYNSGLTNLDLAKMQSAQDLEKMKLQKSLEEEGLRMGAYYKTQDNINQEKGRVADMFGKGMSAFAASDERLKNSKEMPEKELSGFLKALGSHKYTYKNKAHGSDEYVSPMAQEIESHPLGKGLVVDTPIGKVVNYARAGGVMMSAASMLNDKVESLENQLKKVLSKRRAN